MSTTLESSNPAITTTESTWRFQYDPSTGAIECFRETVTALTDGTIISRSKSLSPIAKTQADIDVDPELQSLLTALLAKTDEWAAHQGEPLTLEQLKRQKIAEFDRLCTAAINGGFLSSALGAPHRYSSMPDDKFNLKSSRDDAIEKDTPLYYVCTDSEGLKTGRLHTVAQIKQVWQDGLDLARFLIFKFHPLRLAVEAAESIEAIEAINWDEPPT